MTFLQRFFLCLILIAPLAAFAGKKAPKVVSNDMLKVMKPGAVIVDISVL